MINKVILLGNVGKAPELYEFENGKAASFTLATSETYKDQSGEKKTATEWHNIRVFGKLADVVMQYVTVGMQLYCEGKKKTNEYEKDGVKHYSCNIIVETLKMLGSTKEKSNTDQQANQQTHQQSQEDFAPQNNDLPF